MTNSDRVDKELLRARTHKLRQFFVFSRKSKLSDVSLSTLLLAALWMAFAYGPWLFLREIHGDQGLWALLPVVLGFTPLALWALYDYRLGLLLAVVAAPLLTAPAIPHGFTQGFGDLFAACAVMGYLLRHPDPREWFRLWRREYVWLILILVAALISLGASPVWGQQVKYGIKYGLAEIVGYILAMAYMVILISEARSRLDFKAVIHAVAAAMLIVILFSLASLAMSLNCVGGYGARTALTTNGALSSTLSNPNYHASYLLAVLPMALWFFTKAQQRSLVRYLAATAVILIVFFIQTALSRSGLVGLVVIWVGWIAIARWERGSRTVGVIFGLMLPITVALWWYPAYACTQPSQATSVSKSQPFDIGSFFRRIETAEGNSKSLGDTGVSVRTELARNALKAWRDHPVTGVGVGLLSNFSSVGGQLNRAHNVPLTLLAEQGVIGLLPWIGWLSCLLAVFWRARRQIIERDHAPAFLLLALVSMLVQSMFMDFYRVIWLWQLSALVLAWGALNLEVNNRGVINDSR